MICRIWRGWTTPENATRYQDIVLNKVFLGIEGMNINGFQHIDVLRKDESNEVEFTTFMWFNDLDAIRSFTGNDYTVSHVPSEAKDVLSRFDSHAAHHEIIDKRSQIR